MPKLESPGLALPSCSTLPWFKDALHDVIIGTLRESVLCLYLFIMHIYGVWLRVWLDTYIILLSMWPVLAMYQRNHRVLNLVVAFSEMHNQNCLLYLYWKHLLLPAARHLIVDYNPWQGFLVRSKFVQYQNKLSVQSLKPVLHHHHHQARNQLKHGENRV